MAEHVFGTDLVTVLRVTIAAPIVVGNIGTGVREIIPITGGSMDGPLLRGVVLAGGADWCLTRPDGHSEVWARYTLETHDGVLIGITNKGIVSPTPDGNFAGHTTPTFEVADGAYDFLRRATFAATLLTLGDGSLATATIYRLR